MKKVVKYNQSHYIEVAQWDISMEQKMWFGADIGSTEKEIWGRGQLWATFEGDFFMFSGDFFFQFFFENFVATTL